MCVGREGKQDHAGSFREHKRLELTHEGRLETSWLKTCCAVGRMASLLEGNHADG